jgi:hypothetical protein
MCQGAGARQLQKPLGHRRGLLSIEELPVRETAVSDVVFFGKFDAMSRATNGTIGRVAGLRMVSNDYLFVPRGDYNCRCACQS